MKNHSILLLALSACLPLSAAAQSSTTAPSATPDGFTISGEVRDSISGEVQPFVTIALTPAGAARPTVVATADADGLFTIAAPKAGQYTLQVISVGRPAVTRSFTLGAERTIAAGTILMQDASTTLGAAEVTAQRPLVKAEIDRIGYSVEDDPSAPSSTVLDILRKTPLVRVDGEDNITVNGSSSFKVYVNGKLNQMMSQNPSLIFKNYPASAIKKIEVVTSPGAKYDAEGTGGIINIVTEQSAETDGYVITPTLTASNQFQAGSVLAIFQKKKFTASINYSLFNWKGSDIYITEEREVWNDATNHLYRSFANGKSQSTGHMLSLDASYEFSEHDLLSVSAGIQPDRQRSSGPISASMLDADGGTTYAYDNSRRAKYANSPFNASVDFQHNFGREEQNLTLSYRFTTSPSDSRDWTLYNNAIGALAQLALTDRNEDIHNRANENTVQLDFTTPLGKLHKLATGVKYINRLTRANSLLFTRPYAQGSTSEFAYDADASTRYRHMTDIGAVYAEYTLKLNPFTARTGLRYEYSEVNASFPDGSSDNFTAHFSNLVPSVALSYNFSTQTILTATYDMRIGRPGISYLSPYVSQDSPEIATFGNPNLDAETSHSLAASISTFSAKWNFIGRIYYNLQTDGLTSYTYLSPENVFTTTYANKLHDKTLGLNLTANFTVAKGTQLTVNAWGSYADKRAYRYYNDADARTHGFTGGAYGSINQKLPAGFKLQLFGIYSDGEFSLQGKSASFSFYQASLSRSFLKEDRLTLSAFAGNFIRGRKHFGSTYENDVYRSYSNTSVNLMRVGASISWRIGSLKTNVKRVERSIENNDVKNASSGNAASAAQSGM